MLTIFLRTGLIPIFWQVRSYQFEWYLTWRWMYCLNIPWLRPECWRSWGGYPLNTLIFYLWWSILDEKLDVPLTMDLVTDIRTGWKGSTMPDKLNLLLNFWYISYIFLLLLITEVKIFLYYGNSRDCEGMSYSIHICWYRVYASSLTPVGSCKILMWLTLFL